MIKKLIILYLLILKYFIGSSKYIHHKILHGELKGQKFIFNLKTNNEYILGNYETEHQDILRKNVKHGNIVYDIGAHTGFLTLFSSRLVGDSGRVFAFEPLPENYTLLKEHLKINGVRNVSSYQLAISNSNKTVFFTNNPNSFANTYIQSSPMMNIAIPIIEIQAVALDVFIKGNNLPLPDLIKIDVEGAEYDVLQGAENSIRASKPLIILATHNNHNPGVEEDCLRFLFKHNYKIMCRNSNKHDSRMKDFILVNEDVSADNYFFA